MSDTEIFEALDKPDLLDSPKRRTFLVVLSVFTFINALVRIGFSIFLFIMINLFRDPGDTLDSQAKWSFMVVYAAFFSGLVNTIGVIMMLRRKRTGFLVYLGGQVLVMVGAFSFFFLISGSLIYASIAQYLILLAIFVFPILNSLLYFFANRSSQKTIDK